jgi:hypothetical protein
VTAGSAEVGEPDLTLPRHSALVLDAVAERRVPLPALG